MTTPGTPGDGGLFSSDAFLESVAASFFHRRRATIDHVAAGGHVFRVLIGLTGVVTSVPSFPFFYEPLMPAPAARRHTRVGLAVDGIVPVSRAPGDALPPGRRYAPLVDFRPFPTFRDYLVAQDEARHRSSAGNIASQRRRIARHFGDATYVPDDPEALRLLLAWKTVRARERHWGMRFDHPRLPQFYGALRDAGLLRTPAVRAGDRLVAAAAVLDWPGRVYFKLTAFDPAFAGFSPGAVLLADIVEETFTSGAELDMQIGFFANKRPWATHVRLLAPVGESSTGERVLRRLTKPFNGRLARSLRQVRARRLP